MSGFDNFQNVFDEKSSSLSVGSDYGGISLSEVLSVPILAEQYGLVTPRYEYMKTPADFGDSKELDTKTLIYFIVPQAIIVIVVLGFTFLF